MELDLEGLRRVVNAYIAGELSVEAAAQRIVALGFGNGFGVSNDLIDDMKSSEGRRLQELVWNVARVYNARRNDF